ncbi:FmdB family zinc ribbon protein [Micromonospora sp. HM5-17]|uniref:FmdB family zinc ribbon protein n=1 Tax=Micromonospora sp. HM5-17 TaxID=2487710 RepID=UPI000F4AF424|nr:FmdB family zinc ribbon protein [Micromonospora sp. HM5-17]ROT32030.1 FmdB family transcriptional regulator [Micromonospora sp. HM5-17]
MPTYQYACTECGHQLEAVQSFSDEPLTECPACQGRLRKLFNSVGIVFKGSGFYRTDSRNNGANGGSTTSDSTRSSATSSGSNGGANSSGSANGSGGGSGTTSGAASSTSTASASAA